MQWVNIRETNCAIQWIEIYPVNNVNHLLNNLELAYILQNWLWLLTEKNTAYDGNKLIMNIVLVYYRRKILYKLVI